MTTLVVAAAASWAMAGVLWMVQLVQYPILARYGDALAAEDHQRRISWIVGPLMGAEVVTAIWLLASRPDDVSAVGLWLAALLLVAALMSTVLLQVPLHRRLARGDVAAAVELVRSNWLRTCAWTARAMVLGVLLASA